MSENTQDKEQGDRISFRLSPAESARVKRLLEHLASKAGKYERVTQKRLFLEGLEALEARYDKAIKDRERRARQRGTKSES